MTTIDQLNQLNLEDFVSHLGGIYELSPWVAEATWEQRPFAGGDSLIATMRGVVDNANPDRKRELLRAHPDLAGKLAIEDRLTAESRSEQASLGLDQLSAGEFEALSDLNHRYRQKFDMPFIVCVRLLKDIPELLATFRSRIEHDAAAEKNAALEQVHAIAELRLRDLLD